MIARTAPPEHFPWFTERTGYLMPSDFTAIEAVDGAGRILGMVGFDHWMPNSAHIHLAMDSAAAVLPLLRKAFEHPFQRARVGVLVAVIAASNPKMLRLAERLGFRETGRIRDGWAVGSDSIVLDMRREECRWLMNSGKAA